MQNIDTPALIIDEEILLANIGRMAAFAKEHGVKLRPHFKTHKIPRIAQLQMQQGAVGITVAKLGEAAIAIEAGITDILVACPIIGEAKLRRLLDLARRAKITVAVDSLEAARQLSLAALDNDTVIDIYIEVDTGLRRCGLPPGPGLTTLAAQMASMSGLALRGLMTHAGHVYGAADPGKVADIGLAEGASMVALADVLRRQGISIAEVSVGSTPTVPHSGRVAGVTEIRPGNYVFNDAIQIGLGVATAADCALRVLATVVSAPEPRRRIIDAGSKVFALDKGAHGASVVKGFGAVLGWPGWELARLSEELGVMESETDQPGPAIGDSVEVIPNHACTAINLASEVLVRRAGQVAAVWPVAARGQVR